MRHFQSSAGIYKHIKETVCESFQQDLTPDLNTEVLSSLTYLMLAQAQEIFVLKAIHGEQRVSQETLCIRIDINE
jgi:programmed cell death 6-interacting protein